MKRYIRTAITDDTIYIDITVNIYPILSDIAASKSIKRSVHKNTPKEFSLTRYLDFITRMISVIKYEYGFTTQHSDTSSEDSLSYYYRFTKQDTDDKTIKLVLSCRVSNHDESPEAINRRSGHEYHEAAKLKTENDSAVKYAFYSINVEDKVFKSYADTLVYARELIDEALNSMITIK